MHIHFGLKIDGAPDISPIDRLGYARVGPQGMLTLLEGELGLSRPQPSQGKRILDYAEALAACGGNRFYRASFDVDRLGVARELLCWRDAWYLDGWRGQFDQNAPVRMCDMGAVEAIAKKHLAPGIGERLADVALRLTEQRTQIESVHLLDPLDDFPLRWRRVLDLLPIHHPDGDQLAVSPAPTFSATDLAHVQAGIRALAAQEKIAPVDWQNDGSLIIVADGASDPLIASLAQLSGKTKARGERIAVIATNDAAALDDALSGAGLPRTGIDAHSLAHPALQLLPLALHTLWEPADVATILDFLNHPLTPLGAGVARALTEVVAGTPGTGGEAWNAALDKALKNTGADYADRQRKAVEQWVRPSRYAATEGIPIEQLRSRIEALATEHRSILGRLNESGDHHPADVANRFAALAHCLALADLLATTTSTRIRPRELGRLLDFASQNVATTHGIAEVGHVALVSDPAALTDEVDTLVWWRCSAPRLPTPYPWTEDEMRALKHSGAELPAIETLLEQQSRQWLHAVSRVKRQLIIILPPPENEAHPLLQMLAHLLQPLPVIPAAEFVKSSGMIPLPSNPLPARRRTWKLPDDVSIPRRTRYDGTPGTESHSSLSLLLHAPHRWVLRYAAKIQPGRLLAVPETYTLYGLLLHKLAEWLFAEPDWLAWTEADLEAWFARRFQVLIEEQGLVLLQSGRQAELATLRYRGLRAMSSLVRHLKQAGVIRVRTEVEVNGAFKGGPLSGSADLVVENSHGETAIVDLKWSNYGDKYGTLLREGRHLQLAIYAHLLQQDGRAPGVAYFILNTARLLAQTRDYFPDADLAAHPNPEQDIARLWQQLGTHWQWRRDQLDDGLIEVVTEATAKLDEALPSPDEGLPPEKPSDRYDDTLHLAGWGDGA